MAEPTIPAAMQATINNVNRAKQQFIADVLQEKPTTVYRMDDFKTMRGLIFKNVKDAVNKRFPMYNDRFTLSVENVDYQNLDQPGYAQQKKAVLQGKSVGKKLKGQYVLRDAATDKVVSKSKMMTIATVPYMTDRGTFINNGHEYALINIMRLEPGVYTKKHSDDQISAQFNVKKGTGAGFNMRFVPSKGTFIVNRGTANAPAYTVMKDLGVTDEEMKKAWGDELYSINKSYGQGQKARIAASRIYNYSSVSK